jgi:hypothetical protein
MSSLLKQAIPKALQFMKGGPRHQNHSIMNARILSDAQLILWQNQQKVITHAQTKATLEWDCV